MTAAAASVEDPVSDEAPVALHPWWPQGRRAVALAVLALVFLGLGLHQAARDSVTLDEGVDLSSGLTALVHHDASGVPEHPLLPKVVTALPALFAHPVVPDGEARRSGDPFAQSDALVSTNDRADRLDRVVLLARVLPLLGTVGVGLVVHALAARLFGAGGGFVAAAAWLTTPVVLGQGHLAGIDVPFTLAATLAVSASNLTRIQREELSWLRRYCPVGTIGGSILLYRFEEPPGDRPGPDRPAGPCFVQSWSRA